MSPPPLNLEPAERDPVKLRNTALVLVAIILLGGTLILTAYNQWSKSQSRDDRPAVIYRITPERDLRMLRQDGTTAELVQLRNKVTAINVISLRDPAAATQSMEVMRRLAKNRSSQQDFAMISLVVDPIDSASLKQTLASSADSLGIHLPQWWLGSNEPKTLHKFIKNELKAHTYPHEAEGKWHYDSSIVLVDKNGHIRRAVVPQQQGGPPFIATFDFEQAASWDARGVKTGTDRNNVEQLEILLNHTIDKLLLEPYKP